MRYAYRDLGQQQAGSTVVVRWGGSAANVILLDPVNFRKYVDRMPFIHHAGGRHHRSPAQLAIPQDGAWYVVVDLGGHVTNSAPTVEVLERQREQSGAERQEPLVRAL